MLCCDHARQSARFASDSRESGHATGAKPTRVPCPRNIFQRGRSFPTTTGQRRPGARRPTHGFRATGLRRFPSCVSLFARPEQWHEPRRRSAQCRRCRRASLASSVDGHDFVVFCRADAQRQRQASRRRDRKKQRDPGPRFVAFSGEAPTRAVAVSPRAIAARALTPAISPCSASSFIRNFSGSSACCARSGAFSDDITLGFSATKIQPESLAKYSVG